MKLFNSQFSDSPITRRKKSNLTSATPVPAVTRDELPFIKTLDELYNYIKNFDHILKTTAKSAVTHSGPHTSPLMIIGEAPGAEEDEQGMPFVGRSGKLINEELKLLGIDRNKVYVSNIVNWRPPENRTPTFEEINTFTPIIRKHIELVNPKFVLLLGATSMNALYATESPISKVRGKIVDYNENTKMLVTFHPSYILRSEKNRVFLKQDFETLKNSMEEVGLLNSITFS